MISLKKKVNGENLNQVLSKLKGYLDNEITGADVDEWYDGTIPVGDDITKYGVITDFPNAMSDSFAYDSFEVIKEGE